MTPRESLLLDTHVFIWMATNLERLSRKFLRVIETVESRYVSYATAWEIQIKHEKPLFTDRAGKQYFLTLSVSTPG